MSGTPPNPPPNPDEIEIAIFGPGTGESILVHCGENNWICVDSAMESGEPWPLNYLASIGVNPATAVKLIAATHWHSDHVAGIGRIVEACPQAKFICSQAMNSEEFARLVARYDYPDSEKIKAPLREISSAFKTISKRSQDYKKDKSALYVPPMLVQASTLVKTLDLTHGQAKIWSLSPSNEECLQALAQFRKLFVPPEEMASGIRPRNPNHTAIVLHVQIAETSILLGSDLEVTPGDLTGWRAVLKLQEKPAGLACIYKIPHHGSKTAHLPDIWRQLITNEHISVLTPYSQSALPRPDGVANIKLQGSDLYATSLPAPAKIKRRPEVEKTMREMSHSRGVYDRRPELGLVRLRRKISSTGPWKVELFGAAQKL